MLLMTKQAHICLVQRSMNCIWWPSIILNWMKPQSPLLFNYHLVFTILSRVCKWLVESHVHRHVCFSTWYRLWNGKEHGISRWRWYGWHQIHVLRDEYLFIDSYWSILILVLFDDQGGFYIAFCLWFPCLQEWYSVLEDT